MISQEWTCAKCHRRSSMYGHSDGRGGFNCPTPARRPDALELERAKVAELKRRVAELEGERDERNGS